MTAASSSRIDQSDEAVQVIIANLIVPRHR
jgi:hypothetical protein